MQKQYTYIHRCRCSPVQAERRCQRTNKLPSGVTFTSSRKGPGCNPKQKLSSFLVKNKLLNDHQFGFLPGRSTTQQLVYVVDKWLQTQDKGSASVGVFLDFQKAFDKVWHKGLLFKLACCAVSHLTLCRGLRATSSIEPSL